MTFPEFLGLIGLKLPTNSAKKITASDLRDSLTALSGIVEEISAKADGAVSGIKGNATQANSPTTYSAETYPDGLIETYRAVEPLNNTSAWYTLADATNKAKFPITQDILNANDVLLTATNGVVSVFLNAKPSNIENVFIPTDDVKGATMKATADYLEGLSLSNTQISGSTTYDTPFSLVDSNTYYLNNESFATDKYITTIKGFANSSGAVNIVFGSVVDGKFVERKIFTFNNTTSGTIKTYAINDVLLKGEVYGLKMPSNGMAWKNDTNGLGKMMSSPHGGNLSYATDKSLAFEITYSDYVKTGYTKFSDFSDLKTKVNGNTYSISVGTALESGSTVYDTPIGAIAEQGYYFNNESFNEDRYISKIEMYSVSGGNVFFAFGSVVNGKFVERQAFSFTAVGNKINIYNPNAILLKGEFIALKTPSVGLSWKTGLTDGKYAQSTGYDGVVIYSSATTLSMKITSHSTYTESGYTPISFFNGTKNRINNINTVLKKINDVSVITVGKTSGDFNTIKGAVDSIKTKTGKYVIHILSGVYEETIDLFNVNNGLDLSFIGSSKKDVTVLMRLGDYSKPPMQVYINSYFENITFKSTDELGLANPSSYAVHSDFGNVPALIEYFNCDFINDISNNSAYGAGSWQGHTLRFRNCVFRKNNTSELPGSLFWHNKVQNNVFNQRLEVLFCEFYANGGATLRLNDANQTSQGNTDPALSQASVLFVGNVFKSGNLSADDSFSRFETLRQPGALVGNIYLDEASHGNNITDLNF